jgi:ATP-dependent Lon protease
MYSALPGKDSTSSEACCDRKPPVLIDEVDKIGRGINGDPASALLEMLDPEQNNSFLDHLYVYFISFFILALNGFFSPKAWMFPFKLTSHGYCSMSSIVNGGSLTYLKKLANNLGTIPAPLLDRMEMLGVSGYVSEEKAVIASRYLGPQAKDASGLAKSDVQLEPTALDILIKYYWRKWNLKKHIEKVCVCVDANADYSIVFFRDRCCS